MHNFRKIRTLPKLHSVPPDHVIDFIATGGNYDVVSLDEALLEGNKNFEVGELSEALNAYGICYEIFRLLSESVDDAIRPLPFGHELLLRRAICLSSLNRLDEALTECDLALLIVPHVPATLLLRGLLCSKLGRTGEANDAFKKCVIQDPDLRDFAELLVAMFFQAKRHNDRAVQIATQVLTRTTISAFAYIVRGTALKYHAKGCYHVDAADDFAQAMAIDKSVQPLLGPNFGFDDLPRFDEILLKFHPWLYQRSPLPISVRPRCCWILRGRSWFGFLGLLFTFLGKLKRRVRLTHRTLHLQQREALFKAQTDAVTDRMRGLLSAGYDAEVWQRERELYFRRQGRSKSVERRRPKPWFPAGHRHPAPYVPLNAPTSEDLVGVYTSKQSQSAVSKACFKGLSARSSTSKSPRDSNLISHFPPDLVVDFLSSETRGARHVPDVVKACEVEAVWQWHRDSAASTAVATPEHLPPLSPRSARMSSVLDAASLGNGFTQQELVHQRLPGPGTVKNAQAVDSPWRICDPEDIHTGTTTVPQQAAFISGNTDPRLPTPRITGSLYQEQQVDKPGFLAMEPLETLDTPGDTLCASST
jgi:tetratricopeptide (TPR) repeat protein